MAQTSQQMCRSFGLGEPEIMGYHDNQNPLLRKHNQLSCNSMAGIREVQSQNYIEYISLN